MIYVLNWKFLLTTTAFINFRKMRSTFPLHDYYGTAMTNKAQPSIVRTPKQDKWYVSIFFRNDCRIPNDSSHIQFSVSRYSTMMHL